jgi:hypothetical protein
MNAPHDTVEAVREVGNKGLKQTLAISSHSTTRSLCEKVARNALTKDSLIQDKQSAWMGIDMEGAGLRDS